MMYDETSGKIKFTPLYVQAKKKIIEMIKSGMLKDSKLPPEVVLSEKLGISRTTVREALIALTRDGVVTKKQGIGNLYHLSTLNTRMRIDQIKDFVELLKDGGYTVSVKRLKLAWTDDVSDLDVKPPGGKGSRYLRSELIYYADGKAAILSTVSVPESVLAQSDFDLIREARKSPANSLSDFLNTHSREEVSHSISVFHPTRIGEESAAIFNLEAGDAVIAWKENYYGMYDNLLCFTRIIFHPTLVNFAILRKWD